MYEFILNINDTFCMCVHQIVYLCVIYLCVFVCMCSSASTLTSGTSVIGVVSPQAFS